MFQKCQNYQQKTDLFFFLLQQAAKLDEMEG